ncbi:rhodanese-like domain-containing protein [Porphyromonas macacae]|uniref:rhodanese-like domain-containing protein n=1 Tax=Porphyromonas macacae TaxID=28115 RepID=UPI00359F4C44
MMKKKNIFLGFLSLILIFFEGMVSCKSSRTVSKETPGSNSSIIDCNVKEFMSLLERKNVQLVDVRTPEEYRAGHIDKAILFDVKKTGFVKNVEKKLNKNLPVAVYCRSGARSAKAAKLLINNGFSGPVYNLSGGYLAYKKEKGL